MQTMSEDKASELFDLAYHAKQDAYLLSKGNLSMLDPNSEASTLTNFAMATEQLLRAAGYNDHAQRLAWLTEWSAQVRP